ncbi:MULTISPECIES: phosphoribosylaminoimidazolesuccinocarboxamide synthase [Desulfococcus]|jgi:phosphoribosylaminoimidazole-succinocarboxamide synthase|uniref:Phosphoribosylaminoimidazole-succinocarboxamide synthase n=1 Tax=Desulfococcus multivorans DSM 2059 TaxID=1121405 RepID=S7TPI9_DESML|nr:phosphoribosylaminoimidazolesuccinocarboxamide synthase [Desulfococcus multivorans]AOY58951.1 PurC: phosphoribosylaminoimidazole-succinocarboxamide synthase [Desulfococcus multivorans]AQV01219.1 phosphoribosylaminoimidazolesuccinocarboxamide synthase [Desulfococcus multivorans]EPR39142.1 Phosphoribosylaminoimidazole-succinocarboxamide synthase [Desulfococcus multivorans DSM 2059]MDX9818674.1 phosphoribosylaminoimidazolesuccinocarboxamide synthase [Desulfococcus multivorans]SJZ53930.1 phosph
MKHTVIETHFPGLKLLARGKVRDIYDLGETLLMVATDRISAYDVVLPNPVPAKGRLLTQISLFWFEVMEPIVANHVITGDVERFPAVCAPYKDILKDRSMVVKKARPIPIECVVRGYLSGSGWKSYQESGTVCGIRLPPGLKESEKLPEPIFTPSTKADVGEHDVNIDFDETVKRIGRETAETLKTLSLSIYRKGLSLAEEKGIIIADTKFEFGIVDGDIILIDEILTPDSSRFWPKAAYVPGGSQKSYDKQYVRDYLTSIAWNRQPPGPVLPDDVIRGTQEKYMEAFVALTGKSYDL